MQLTLEADYAVRIVDLLASSEKRTEAAAIAQLAGVPQRFALKILRKLVDEKIVASFKGAGGGYELAREPEKITLREVIEAVEGPYIISRCQKSEYACEIEGCRFCRVYAEISQLVREKLEATTFERK